MYVYGIPSHGWFMTLFQHVSTTLGFLWFPKAEGSLSAGLWRRRGDLFSLLKELKEQNTVMDMEPLGQDVWFFLYGGFQLVMGVPLYSWMVFVRENPT